MMSHFLDNFLAATARFDVGFEAHEDGVRAGDGDVGHVDAGVFQGVNKGAEVGY